MRISDSVAVVIAATLLARLGEGTARFELLEDSAPPVWPRLHCFARIGSSLYVRSFSVSIYAWLD